ncbi:hypothetical protein [Exiguobacterium flavidum]|uniref:hypothetical protein n=1 Tax=Exiguobacterium flavidum TaxID=2184695 RepID=UPI000DF82ADB|nr:hypothetical protein [Exiguobacterium flavidum]
MKFNMFVHRRGRRKWNRLTTKSHIEQLERLYQSKPATDPKPDDRLHLLVMLEEAVRSGRRVRADLLKNGLRSELSVSVAAVFHEEERVELVTDQGVRLFVKTSQFSRISTI